MRKTGAGTFVVPAPVGSLLFQQVKIPLPCGPWAMVVSVSMGLTASGPLYHFGSIVPRLPQNVHTLVGISSRGYRPSATMR